MKANIIKNKNALVRAFYRQKTTRFKKIIVLMVIAGLVASLAYFCKYAYVEYAVSNAHIVLNYPEISQSRYPDGSRFTYYDFTSDENLEAALKIMQDKGKYKNFTAADIRDKFYIYSYLDGSAGATVSSARSEGNDFSYVANEYKITFIQPHDYKDKNIFRKFFGKDLSGEFLEALFEVNRSKFAENKGGIHGFEILTEPVSTGDYDYGEAVNIYKTKINNIITYLKQLEKKQPGFKSATHDMTLSDVRGKYNFLITNRLDGINNFVESSGISKDLEQTTNKINVNIEDNGLKFNKSGSESEINSFAMKNYDQTFTENLINVIQNEQYGLYQARPKTAFDTVAFQMHSADENVAEYDTKIGVFRRELDIYNNVVTTPAEHKRLVKKCDTLIADFEDEYASLTKTATEVVTDYYNTVNESYATAKIKHSGLLSKHLIIKMALSFALGSILAFIIAIFVSTIDDMRKVREKKRLIKMIKKKTEGR